MKAGGVKFADTPQDAANAAEAILKLEIGGHMPVGVLVDPKAEVEQEYYAAVLWDGRAKRPMMLFSDMGGIDIEEVAEKHPDHVGRGHLSNLQPIPDFRAKEVAAEVGMTGRELTRATPVLARLARLQRDYDMTLAEINPLARLADGSFVALDAHLEMEDEAVGRHQKTLAELGVELEEPRELYEPSEFERQVKAIDEADHRGVIQGKDHGFEGNLGLVIGAGGGSLTLTDAVRSQGGKPANYAEIGGNPSVAKSKGLAMEVLKKDGVEKIAVMMSIVSNTRVDIVARGVIKACLELGKDPAETITVFRIPGAWEEEGAKILDRYGIEFKDRSVSMWEAAGEAVEKVQGATA
jgi:succinyl-CoA synthetase beta subunit